MLKALPPLFPNLLGTSSSIRVEFYDPFQPEAGENDREFMKYDEGLNTGTLIIVSLGCARARHSIYPGFQKMQVSPFSAVTFAFIVNTQNNPQPDFQ